MMNYEDTYTRIFRDVSGDDANVIQYIQGVCIDVHSPMTISYEDDQIKATVSNITSSSTSVLVTVTLDIPIVGINRSITVVDGKYTDDNIRIVIDYTDIPYGVYYVNATVLLRNIMVTTSRELSLFGRDSTSGIDLVDGSNVQTTYNDGTLSIVGGPGLGSGRYIGSTDEITKDRYRGLKSVNGLRSDRNISINMTDLLIANGGGIR